MIEKLKEFLAEGLYEDREKFDQVVADLRTRMVSEGLPWMDDIPQEHYEFLVLGFTWGMRSHERFIELQQSDA